jgi:hypothetical protein
MKIGILHADPISDLLAVQKKTMDKFHRNTVTVTVT